MATPAEMVTLLETSLATQPKGVVSVRFADGRTVQYNRAQLLQELNYWQRQVSYQAASGLIQMQQTSLRGEA